LKERLTFSSLAVGDTPGAGGGHSLPKRNEVDGRLHIIGCRGGSSGRPEAQAIREGRERGIPGSKGNAARVPTLWKDERPETARRRSDDGSYPSYPSAAEPSAPRLTPRVRGYGKVALARVQKLHEVMYRLLPQIQYWHRTGWVAAKKIISLGMPKLYSVPRGKVGKPIEFGLSWGDYAAERRLRPGPCCRRSPRARRRTLCGEVCRGMRASVWPRSDRVRLRQSGAQRSERREASQARCLPHWTGPPWAHRLGGGGATKRRLVSERVRVEGSIGTLKCRRYGFNRSRARSEAMMGVCGQRAVLGMNLTKMAKGLAERSGFQLATR
jgi:hypothetical protein